MLRGIYKALKRRDELDSTFKFTNNLQVWLALFAFCALIVAEIGRVIWGWWMLNLTTLQWVLYILGSILVLFFLAIGIVSLYKFLKLLWRAKFGQKIPYDPKTIFENILAVTTPIKDGATIEECRIALARLITIRSETTGKLKVEVEKRISEYQVIIDELEVNCNESTT